MSTLFLRGCSPEKGRSQVFFFGPSPEKACFQHFFPVSPEKGLPEGTGWLGAGSGPRVKQQTEENSTSQPVGPWQAGAGGYNFLTCVSCH